MARSGRMRDMARRMRDRRRSMRDRRNPYGSQGGYVSSRRDSLMYHDMPRYEEDRTRMRGDYNYDMATGRYYDDTEHYGRYDYTSYPDYNYSKYDMHYEPGREYTRRSHYGWNEPMMDYRGRHGYDMASGEDYLSDEELMEWSKDLLSEVEEKDKQYFTKQNIERKAQEMGVQFDEFEFPEFYTTALMMYTDYCKTLGTANMDIYLRLAKDWLMDKDVEIQGSEKLAKYYDEIVVGE